MTIQFLSLEIPLQTSPGELQQRIEATLQHHGEPLRWAITQVVEDKVWVEAVVTRAVS